MHKHLLTLALLVGIGLVVAPSAICQIDDNQNRETLRGLQGVRVTVRPVNADLQRDGITQSKLQTDVELKLRKAGIHVLTEDEWRHNTTSGGGAWLEVYVGAVKNTETNMFYACTFQLKLMQPVRLMRDASIKTFATTWSTGSTGIIGLEKMQTVRQEVSDRVDEFLNAYLTVNPR